MRTEKSYPPRVSLCRECRGTGARRDGEPCRQCDGSGRVVVQITSKIEIHPFYPTHK
jgi:DnaJ-class molecular chaperone